jgi:excisionase family DNA binding protein
MKRRRKRKVKTRTRWPPGKALPKFPTAAAEERFWLSHDFDDAVDAGGEEAVSAPRYARPSPEIAAEAATAARSLAPLLRKRKGTPQHVTVVAKGDHDTRVTVPRAAFELFVRVLGEMANGNAVSIVAVHAELTTQQAADLLNVSRPFMAKLLEDGKMPCRMVGTRRRVRFEDLVRYKQKGEADRQKVYDALAAEAQRLGLEY